MTESKDGVVVNVVNVDLLKQLVGDKIITDADEKHGLNWHGERRARQLALTLSTGISVGACVEGESVKQGEQDDGNDFDGW